MKYKEKFATDGEYITQFWMKTDLGKYEWIMVHMEEPWLQFTPKRSIRNLFNGKKRTSVYTKEKGWTHKYLHDRCVTHYKGLLEAKKKLEFKE